MQNKVLSCYLVRVVVLAMSSLACAGGVLGDASEYLPKDRANSDTTILVCSGDLRIILDGKAKQDASYKLMHQGVSVSDKGGVLYFKGKRNKNFHADVIVAADSMPLLEELRVLEACSVDGDHLRMPKLRLLSRTKSDLKLYGEFGAYAIDQAGKNRVDMMWVDAKELDVTVYDGTLRLAGLGEHARIRASGSAHLQLNHLRVDDLWLLATDNASVDLYSARTLASFTSGSAKVATRKRPEIYSDVSKDSAILVIEPKV